MFEALVGRPVLTSLWEPGGALAHIRLGEDADVVLAFPNVTLNFKGLAYVLDFALPNFFFHETVAYALLRGQGAPIGKTDFLAGGGR